MKNIEDIREGNIVGSKFIISGISDECADTLEEQITMHRQLGWDYLEIRNINRITIDNADEKLVENIIKTLEVSKIKVSCLASDIGKLFLAGEKYQPFEKDIRTLEKLIAFAVRTDCRYIRVMGYKRSDLSDDQWHDRSLERLKVLAAIAQKSGVFLALENCAGWYADSGRKMAEFLEKVGSGHLVCLYDTGNPLSMYGKDSWDYYTEVRDYISYIHIKDAGSKNGKNFCYPGEGNSEVFRILEDQYKRGYCGFISIEPHMAPSAHKPDLKGNTETAWDIYRKYGEKLNENIKKILF